MGVPSQSDPNKFRVNKTITLGTVNDPIPECHRNSMCPKLSITIEWLFVRFIRLSLCHVSLEEDKTRKVLIDPL